MVTFWLIVLPIIATSKVLIQGILAKGKLKSTRDIFIYNGISFIVSAIVISAIFIRTAPHDIKMIMTFLPICAVL